MLSKEWRKTVLEKIPHGEDGGLQLKEEDAISVARLLLRYGYAVCLTNGDFEDNIQLNWLYAGNVDNLDYSDYNNIVFTSPDYLEDYGQALTEDVNEEDEND